MTPNTPLSRPWPALANLLVRIIQVTNELPEDVQALVTKIFALSRDPQAAEELASYIDAGVDVNLTNQDGNTLLMLAAYNGNEPAVRALIERGADVNRVNDRGQTPIAGVLFKKELEIARILVQAGADLDAGHPTARDTAALFGVDISDLSA